MTKKVLKSKIKEILLSDKDFLNTLVDKAVNNMPVSILNQYDDDFRLAKMTLSAIYRDMEGQYRPLHSDKKTDKIITQIYSLI
jgi:hypothetical protein